MNVEEELENFRRNPLAWLQEWNDANGLITIDRTDGSYVVGLWAGTPQPVSTGVNKTVAGAFENAIKGLGPLASMLA